MNEKKEKKNAKTIGQELFETHESHLRDDNIEVGEFTEEVGKKEYLKQIRETIEKRANDPEWQKRYYLYVLVKKNSILHRVIEIYVQPRHTRPIPEPGLTLWSYDPKTKDLKLEWVLPKRQAFHTYLDNPNAFDPFLIDCIRKYQIGKLV
jgi:hypothetical protein